MLLFILAKFFNEKSKLGYKKKKNYILAVNHNKK